MDSCLQTLYGSSAAIGCLLVISEILPFIKHTSANSIVEVFLQIYQAIKFKTATATVEKDTAKDLENQ
jgi:hypothetical protein